LINRGPTRSKAGPSRREQTSGLQAVAEAIENQALEESGDTGGERNWTTGGRRVGRPTGPVHRDNGGRPLARGKGVRKPGPAKEGEKMPLGRMGEMCQQRTKHEVRA